MQRIPNHPLWIGHAGDGRDFRALYATGIRAVLQLALDEPIPSAPRDMIWLRVPLTDGEGNDPNLIRLAVDTLAQLMRLNVPTLVCCSAGLSRAPVITAMALSQLDNLAPAQCLERIGEIRSLDVSATLWRDAIASIDP